LELNPDGRLHGVAIIVLDAILAKTTKTHARSSSRGWTRNFSADGEHAHDRIGTIVGWSFDRRADRTPNPEKTKQLGVLLASG